MLTIVEALSQSSPLDLELLPQSYNNSWVPSDTINTFINWHSIVNYIYIHTIYRNTIYMEEVSWNII